MAADARLNDAKRVLSHYMSMVWCEVGLTWTNDNQVEVEGIVEDIYDAARDGFPRCNDISCDRTCSVCS